MAKKYQYSGGVYQIRNIINGRMYIGSTTGSIWTRLQNHVCPLRKGIHFNKPLQQEWNQHGEDAFVLERVLVCSPENCIMYEQICIDAAKSVYNITRVRKINFGHFHSEESLEKMRKKKTPEHSARISDGNKRSAQVRRQQKAIVDTANKPS